MKYDRILIFVTIILLKILELNALSSDYNYQQFCDSQDYNEELCTWEQQRQNINFLSKALGQFLASDRYQMQSELTITGNFNGGSLKVRTGVKTIIEAPNKIRSQITFYRPDDSIGNQYLVVSNGSQVWIHDRKRKVYSIMSYKDFVDYNDALFIGLLTSLSLEIKENTKNDVIWQNLSEAELTQAIESELQANYHAVKSEIQTQYKIYEYILPKSNYKMTFYVKPATATIEQLHFYGREDDMDILMEENVIQTKILPSVDSKAFIFVPPADAKQVDEPLSITPF